MTLSGPEALKSLEDALRDVRRDEDEIAKRLARSAELITKMREQEGELLRQLAAVRLDPATQAELAGTLSQAELKARQQLKAHGDEVGGIERKLKAADESITKATAERAKLQEEAGKRDAELKALGDKVRPTLANDPAYTAKLAAAKELAAVAGESMLKTTQAEADREQKGRPYRDDPLFMYLWEAGYGTRNYRANSLVAFFDGKVAALTGFPEARPNFAMLNEIPLRLREHAERQQQLADAALEEVSVLENAAIDAAGGKAARDAMDAAIARIEALDKEIVGLQDQRDELAKAQRDLAQGSDPAFAAAISGLAEALGREDLKQLLADARATQTGQDDTLVQQIDDVRQRVNEEDYETRDQKARLKTLAARRRELEDIQYEFKKQGFDNPRSTFRQDDLVGDVLNEFLRGGISAANYWEQWRRSQNWTPAPRDDWNFDERFGSGNTDRGNSPWGDFKWPDNSFSGGNRKTGGFGGPSGGWGRSSGGGGTTFTRPRSGSSGNRTSGGFKTGGGF